VIWVPTAAVILFFFSSRRRHTRSKRDWSSDVCSSDLWFGRWGTNYLYGTWSVLAGLNAAGVDPASPEIRRAVDWLISVQREDGGWGESGKSYWPDAPHGRAPYSTASQTAWALLGLMAAGEVDHPAV